jgi:uncharacterized protein YggT (Ycf19 family)
MARNLRWSTVMTTTTLDSDVPLSRQQELLGRAGQVCDYIFGLLYALLAIRLVLELIGARRTAGFVEFIVALTSVFYAPFKGIVPNDSLDGSHPIVWPIVIAILAYMILHMAVRGLLRLLARS